ncbi:putative G-protein coupled receptor 156 isoform X1 [Mytilus galloprovincialis]|uniref:putative G-protein coupled receptor 156 isoform X1 n=2 Tax=Mytilus galloprovincialis TaxID=29158 RepID=UPI003F7C7CB4
MNFSVKNHSSVGMLTMETRTISVGTFVASCFATTIGVVVSVSFLTFNLFHRHKRFMKMSSPNLNILISAGGILLNIVCLMYGMDYFFVERYQEATVTCQMRLWMIVFGVSLVFGPIFSKSWRVYKIFRNAGIKKVVIKDKKLFMICGIVLCLDAFLLFLWQIIDLVQSKRVAVLLKKSNTNNTHSLQDLGYIQECTCGRVDVWLSLIFIWKSLIFSYGLYIAWKTRNVLLPPMKDSPSIIISVIFSMCTTSLVVVMSSLLRHDPDAVYVLHILSITTCCVVIQITVFLPKVLYWWRTPIEKPVRLSTSVYEYGGLNSEEEMYELIAENRALKKSLTEKASKLSKLEENLQTAKQTLKSMSEKDFKLDGEFDVDLSEFKLDSGLDVDLSEVTSTDDELSIRYGKTRIKTSMTRLIPGTNEVSNVNDVPKFRDHATLQRSNSDRGRMVAYRKQQSRTSVCSLQNYYRSTECYDNLQASLKSKNDIVGSVAKSYNLDDNEDTLSYVSSYLPLKGTRRKLNYTLKDTGVYLSPANTTTISNDQLYPSFDDELSFGSTIIAKSSNIDPHDKPSNINPNDKTSVSKSKRHKKYRTPKPSYERTKQGDKIVVRKCYYL